MATAADILGVHQNGRVPGRWSKHYQRLCAERDRLCAREFGSPEVSPIKLDDLTDAASDEIAADLSFAAERATKYSIFEVLAAIRRIERGIYGTCELTGLPIDAERLRAIPWTRFSLEGQRELEKTGSVCKHALPKLGSLAHVDDGHEGEGEEPESA
jgi:RNA polymerase-binding transcription factor DksA